MMFYGPPAGMPANAPQSAAVSAPAVETALVVIIPSVAFGVTKRQIAAWEKSPAPPYYSITLVPGRCGYTADAATCDGYLMPSTPNDTSYIAGWLQGRRSAGRS